jgi:hypothetical protein
VCGKLIQATHCAHWPACLSQGELSEILNTKARGRRGGRGVHLRALARRGEAPQRSAVLDVRAGLGGAAGGPPHAVHLMGDERGAVSDER